MKKIDLDFLINSVKFDNKYGIGIDKNRKVDFIEFATNYYIDYFSRYNKRTTSKAKIKSIISGDYKYNINQFLTGKISTKLRNDIKSHLSEKDLKKVFESLYNDFRDYLGIYFLELFQQNNIFVCPYCNINKFELILVENSKKLIPTLDHIENKAKDWLGRSINIYNILPSCYICNSQFKGEKEIDLLLNPYNKDYKFNFEFSIITKLPINSFKKNIKEIIIEKKSLNKEEINYLCGNSKISSRKQTFSFYIEERIQNFKYEAENFIWEYQVHNELFGKHILSSLSGRNNGIYFDQKLKKLETIHEIPLSKLYLDIYNNYLKKKYAHLQFYKI